jgi:mono/diheme cytochrome c family protein
MKRGLCGWAFVALLIVAVGVPSALAHTRSTPKVIGNAKAGKPAFQSTCGVCHRLRAASSTGTIGPDLDKLVLTEPVIIKAIANGGASVMTKARAAKYATEMTAYKGALTTAQIQDIAAFVYNSTHHPL